MATVNKHDPNTPDIDDETYFALPSFDQSQLKAYMRNPAEWAYNRINGVNKDTPSLRFGTAFHNYLLQTANVVSLAEGETMRSKANKAWVEEQQAEGNIVVSYDDMQRLNRMRDALRRNKKFADLIDNGYPEQTIEWTDVKTGIRLKAKIDLLPAGVPYFVDLKTARTSDPAHFAREAYQFGYHIQACFYSAAIAALGDKAEQFGRKPGAPTGCQFWVWGKDDNTGDFRNFLISRSNPMFKQAQQSIRAGLDSLAVDIQQGEDAGLGEGIDAAARWCLEHTQYPKEPEEVDFPDWVIRSAEEDMAFDFEEF